MPPADRLSLIPRSRSRQSEAVEEPEEEEVQVTWFELFFDLVFVVAISKIAAPLEEVETLFSGVTGVYILRITCIWWIWHTATGCANTIRQGAAMWVMTFTTLALVCFAARACQRNDNRVFLYFYAAARILNTATYVWVLTRGADALSVVRYKAFRFVVLSSLPFTAAEAGLAFTAAALANGPSRATTVPPGACIVCWITLAVMWPAIRTLTGIACKHVDATGEKENPFDVSRAHRASPKDGVGCFSCARLLPSWQESHFQERYQLLTLIFLGEVVTACSVATADATEQYLLAASAIVTACIAFSLVFLARPADRRNPW